MLKRKKRQKKKIKKYPKLSDRQVGKLVGSTKNTVSLIKNNNYWNSSNLIPKDPVVSNLCSQIDIKNAVEKASRKVVKEKKKIDKENKKIEDKLQKKALKKRIYKTLPILTGQPFFLMLINASLIRRQLLKQKLKITMLIKL